MPDCNSIIPAFCGSKGLSFPQSSCSSMHIDGADDVTINQGVGIDLTEGVTAYDKNGNEIEFTVSPDEIDKCDVGRHSVLYTATGEDYITRPSICGEDELHIPCDITRGTITEERIVTITQADPPTFEGVDDVTISPNTDFDPMSGVSAEDDNGNALEVTYDGNYDLMARGAIASFVLGEEKSAKSLQITIEPQQAGSGDPSPDNVRPISGWTGANVSVSGVNVWDEEWELGYYRNGVKTANTTSICCKNLIPIKPGTQYYIGYQGTITCYYNFYDRNGNFMVLSGADAVGRFSMASARAITSPSGAYYMAFAMASAYGTTYNNDISINYPSTDHDYHAYNGNVYPISWQTEAGTVYGGTLDVTSGVLTSARKAMTFSGEWTGTNFAEGTNTCRIFYPYSFFVDAIKPNATNICNILCDKLPTFAPDYIYSNDVMGISENRNSSQNGFWIRIDKSLLSEYSAAGIKAWITANPVTVLYEFATPQQYQIEATPITLLQGENNVWCDTGSTTVTWEEPIPQGESYQYAVEGEYTITYTAEDECGNVGTAIRTITVE